MKSKRERIIKDPEKMMQLLYTCAERDACNRCPYEDIELENELTGLPQGCQCIERMMLDCKDIIKEIYKENTQWESKYERLKRGLEQ